MKDKLKTALITTAIVGTLGTGVLTGGGITHLDTPENGWITKAQYKELKTDFKTKYQNKEISDIDVLWSDAEDMKVLRAIIRKEGKHKLENINENNLIEKKIKEL